MMQIHDEQTVNFYELYEFRLLNRQFCDTTETFMRIGEWKSSWMRPTNKNFPICGRWS